MILVDANVLMYAAGGSHAHKGPSLRLLQRVASGEVDAAIDAETLQEILHRYRTIGRWEEGSRLFELARRVFVLVLPITAETLDDARELMDRHPPLMDRDALHAAVCMTTGSTAICSYDRDLDVVDGLTRVEPSDLFDDQRN